MQNEQDRLLTREEVEERFGISKRSLEISAQRGDGPPMIRIGRRMVRYSVLDIADWIAARRVSGRDDRVEGQP